VIEIVLARHWKEAGEKKVVRRLRDIICGSDTRGPFEKESGYRWQLDESNDWWAELRGNLLVVDSRLRGDDLEKLLPWLEAVFSD